MNWLDARFLLSMFTAIFVGGMAWGWSKRNQEALLTDIKQNDERLWKEFNNQLTRDRERFNKLEENISSLETHRLHVVTRLAQIESDSTHTRNAVDEMSNDVKEIVKQLTAVATKIDSR